MFKPLLAYSKMPDFQKLVFPMIATPKLDGIRCLFKEGMPVSRTLKPIPNKFISEHLRAHPLVLDGMDGELITYQNGKMKRLNEVNGDVMRADGQPDFIYHVFDRFDLELPYFERIGNLAHHLALGQERVRYVESVIIDNLEQLEAYEAEVLALGYEGVMLRDPNGRYKNGRSTENERILLKIKRFTDAEARIVGFVELMHNENEATKDELGHTKRSSAKDGKVAGGTLGALVVEWSGITFEIGTGFDAATRQWIWDNQDQLFGKWIKFKFREILKSKPTLTSFIAFRDEIDMDIAA